GAVDNCLRSKCDTSAIELIEYIRNNDLLQLQRAKSRDFSQMDIETAIPESSAHANYSGRRGSGTNHQYQFGAIARQWDGGRNPSGGASHFAIARVQPLLIGTM